MRLLVVSERYPVENEPVFTFLDELLLALKSLQVDVTVISPQSVTRVIMRKGVKTPTEWIRLAPGGGFTVFQPRYLTLSNKLKLVRGVNLASYRNAVRRKATAIGEGFDACYAHFWHSAVAIGLALPDKPLFVACGEHRVKAELASDVRRIAGSVRGVISVSGVNKADCEKLYGVKGDLIEVIPNAVDTDLFRPREDRDETRKALGISESDFVVAFVGWFDERKGVKRLEIAAKELKGVKIVYMGYGPLKPEGGNIAYCARVEHDEIPKMLCACDVFVLPTRAEGCCNAIVEAMACGLPIISSNKPFNDDLLNESNSLRVDSDDTNAIRNAIERLRDDKALREKLSRGALSFASGLSIKSRAERIKKFITDRI